MKRKSETQKILAVRDYHRGKKVTDSHPGTPHDNAVAEAFFRTLKKECIYRNNFKSEAEFKKELDSYIDFYNNQREQHYLRYHSPVQFEFQMT